MAENETPNDPAAPAPEPEAAPPPPVDETKATSKYQKDLMEKIAEKSAGIRTKLIDINAEKEVLKRIECMQKAIDKHGDARKELQKLYGQGQKTFNKDKSPGGLIYSKEQMDSIGKKEKEIESLENAIASAFDEKKVDYSKLKQLVGEKPQN